METTTEKTPEQTQHESNKVVREGLAFAHYKLSVTPMLLEEHEAATLSRNVLHALCLDLQKKIEVVEPPKPAPKNEAPKTPYIMEVPMSVDQ